MYPNLAPFAHVVRIKVIPDSKSQFKVTFTHVQKLSQDQLHAVFSRVAEAEQAIVPADPFPPIQEAAPPPPKARSRNAPQAKRKY
jgi:hypothetical protein